MKHIPYSSINGTNFLAAISFIIGIAISLYVGKSILFAFGMAFFGLLFMRFLTFTKCFKFSYDEKEIILINVMLPFIEYQYEISKIEKINIDSVMNWGSGVYIKDKAGRKRIFGFSGSELCEIEEMIEFVDAKIKERKNKSISE
ncbi:hypothetical protein QYS49_39630 [Marivirga salinae]|uniref:Uncharacterized protein n=1 Tax=Marivirga salinarum TaxID=3059078 RepID=A0AA51NB95_9BACT|nr:hypothetical protein [Marivirga sp. BDSF4-3]WMN11810.1 hypothetical protein QYS49_39630 [Marivirga sp. BDSF4-3]